MLCPELELMKTSWLKYFAHCPIMKFKQSNKPMKDVSSAWNSSQLRYFDILCLICSLWQEFGYRVDVWDIRKFQTAFGFIVRWWSRWEWRGWSRCSYSRCIRTIESRRVESRHRRKHIQHGLLSAQFCSNQIGEIEKKTTPFLSLTFFPFIYLNSMC